MTWKLGNQRNFLWQVNIRRYKVSAHQVPDFHKPAYSSDIFRDRILKSTKKENAWVDYYGEWERMLQAFLFVDARGRGLLIISIIIIIIIIIIQTFVLKAPINEKHHIGARSARRESVNLKQASFQQSFEIFLSQRTVTQLKG